MAFERTWASVSPQAFAVNGGTGGQITLASTAGFKVKQSAYLNDTLQNKLPVQIKRVLSPTQLIVGPIDNNLTNWKPLDISAYTVVGGAVIGAEEQQKNNIPWEDHYKAVYEADPTVADRIVVVDEFGNFIDSVTDSNGINRLAVDGQFTAEVDVQVDVDIDGVYNPTTNPDPDSVGIVANERSNPTTEINQTQRVTAKRGTTDTDTVSEDVSIHDHNGNQFTLTNPLPVTSGFEKFYQLIGDSNWMNLATYDQITPAFSLDGKTLTLSYFEDGDWIGDAVIVFNSEIDFSLLLKRYINNDGEGLLLNDDDVPLNLD